MYKLSDGIPKHLTDMLDAAICLQMSILEVGSALECCQCAPAPRRGSLVARVLGGSGACCCGAFFPDQ
jgi:hypothetical protein